MLFISAYTNSQKLKYYALQLFQQPNIHYLSFFIFVMMLSCIDLNASSMSESLAMEDFNIISFLIL